jgi:hypothetical protein
MKNWTLLAAMMLGFCLWIGGGRAQATSILPAGSGSITVTVSLVTETSVSLSPTSWAIGPITLNGTNGPSNFTATVGNSATKLEIKGANAAGGWTIGAPPAADRFEVAVTSPALTLTTDYQVLAASVAGYGSQPFALTFKAPTTETKGGGVDQSFAITVKASAP